MRTKLTQGTVDRAQAEPGAERTVYWDTAMPGFELMVTAKGHRSFVLQYRACGLSHRLTLNGSFLRHETSREKKPSSAADRSHAGAPTLADARREAQAALGALARGRDPLAELRQARNADRDTLRAIAEEYLKREGKNLRSIENRRSTFHRFVYPRFGSRPINSIKRSELVRLLDHVEDNHGPVASQHTLVAIRRLFNWHAARDDDFLSPIVPGMGRISIADRARDRILNDDELRAVWAAASVIGRPYGSLVQFILLTATRIAEAANMNKSELNGIVPRQDLRDGLS